MKFSIGTALLCFSLSSYIVQVSISKLFESFGWLLLKVWFWTFLCCFHGSLLSAQRCYDFHVLPILFKSQCWNISKVSVDYTCKCNAEFSLWFSMSPLNSALLCFSRASCFVQVSIMKVFKSSIDYALRNFVSNLSLFFWWKFSIGTALLWFSRSSYFVQVSMLKHFQSFGSLLLKVWFWTFLCCFHGSFLSAQRCFVFHFLPILFKSQCWNCLRVSVDYTCKCNAEISLWFSMSPLNSALLCFSRASCFVQVSIMKVFKSSIDYALRNFVSNLSLVFCWSFLSAQRCFAFHFLPILFKFQSQNFLRVSVDCFWRFDSELFCVVFTEVSCRHSAALIFMFFLFCSSLNVETFREYRWTTLANLMLRLLFGFQCLH